MDTEHGEAQRSARNQKILEKSLGSLYYKSATLYFFSKVVVNQNKQTWIDEAPRGLIKKTI